VAVTLLLLFLLRQLHVHLAPGIPSVGCLLLLLLLFSHVLLKLLTLTILVVLLLLLELSFFNSLEQRSLERRQHLHCLDTLRGGYELAVVGL
jgi:hypothetical protein